ncbi:hypothetical protein [Xanthomonas phage BUDD]|nr:hypothetical protein [Xanthomonas phage BUDD]
MKKILLAVALMMPLSAMAQNIIMDTNTQMLTQTMMASANEPSRPKPTAHTFYKERVPGKPEEGFIPVTRNAPAVNYVQDKVRVEGKTIYMLDDRAKGIKCYFITYFTEREPAISCVKY